VKLSECVVKVDAMCDDVCITHRRTGVISLGTHRQNACFHLCKFKLITGDLQNRPVAVAPLFYLLWQFMFIIMSQENMRKIGVNKEVPADVSWYRALTELKKMRTIVKITENCKNRECPFVKM
jgi:hypothetical protein